MLRRALALVLAVTALPVLGCRPGTVRVAFRPRPGARYRYHVVVRTEASVSVSGQAPQRTKGTVTIDADQTVLEAGPEGSRVEVSLGFSTGEQRRVVVRLDRAAQLVGIDPQTEGGLGDLGVAEVFPAAAGAPPDRRLRPGERWRVNEAVELPDSVPVRLSGDGRLLRLAVVSGRRTATIQSNVELPVVRRTASVEGRESVLEGSQHTTLRTTQALVDGAVQEASATTTASYHLRLLPPAGIEASPVPGTLDLTVRSETVRRD